MHDVICYTDLDFSFYDYVHYDKIPSITHFLQRGQIRDLTYQCLSAFAHSDDMNIQRHVCLFEQ